jgi:hypothetical protein
MNRKYASTGWRKYPDGGPDGSTAHRCIGQRVMRSPFRATASLNRDVDILQCPAWPQFAFGTKAENLDGMTLWC